MERVENVEQNVCTSKLRPEYARHKLDGWQGGVGLVRLGMPSPTALARRHREGKRLAIAAKALPRETLEIETEG